MSQTTRRYYDDAYATAFQARVIAQKDFEGRAGVALDTTLFYPTSGGQPHDLGTLNGVAVLDVIADDGLIWHVLAQTLHDSKTVQGQIDWARRFDHMQQHSGQHILSRAFEDLYAAQTIGFHLSPNSVTIDLDHVSLSAADLAEAERRANEIVLGNQPIKVWFPPTDVIETLPLRKISDKVSGALRVVEIGDFDICACGGTHVNYTGEIGQIKLIRAERSKKHTRVEFRCGWRALSDYGEKNDLLLNLAADLTLSYRELPQAFERLRDENKNLGKQVKTQRGELLKHEALSRWEAARQTDPQAKCVIIAEILQSSRYETADLQALARHLSAQPKTIALLALMGEDGAKGHLLYARSDDLKLDLVPLLKASLETLGSTSGGGRPNLAQGGGFSADLPQLESVINYAKARATSP